jgi:serine/threonine protein kinase/Flp pilus assembly protein TadD
MVTPSIQSPPDAQEVAASPEIRKKQDTARVQGARPLPEVSPRRDPRTVTMSTADQVGEYLISAELVHETRWNEAVQKVGKRNLHQLLAELAAPNDSEDDLSSTTLLRERKLTRYQIDQILAGKISGLTLGPFILRKRLGRGGMAEVLQAYNRELDRIEAVKVLRTDKQRGNLDLAALARREARVLASLVHPNITTVFRADTTNGVTYLSMEFVPGETVEAKVTKLNREGDFLPIREAVRIALETSFALAYAHSKQIIHRDVKPGNIMVTPDNRVKVLDVGIAAIFAPDKEESLNQMAPKNFSSLAGFGTPHFMAPEQWKDNQTTASVDVYGLAATLFHMLAGRPPFVEKDLEILLARKQEGAVNPATIRREIPVALGRVIQKALAGNPSDRYASMEAFAAALEPYSDDHSMPVRKAIPWTAVFGVFALAAVAFRMPVPDPAPPTQTIVIERPAKATEFNWKGKYFKSIVDAAEQARTEGDLASAGALFVEAAGSAPEQADEFKKKAGELFESLVTAKLKVQPQQALETAGWALTLIPNSSRLHELKGDANLRLNRYEEAAVQFDLAAAKEPTRATQLRQSSADALKSQAKAHAGAKRFKEADEVLRNAGKRYQESAESFEGLRREVLINWAEFLVESGNATAAAVVAEAKKATPGRPEPLRLTANLFERTKNWKDAAEAWIAWGTAARQPAVAASKAAACWRRWGEESISQDDHRTALTRFEKALQVDGSDAETNRLISASRNQLGFSLHQRGDDAAAVAEYTKAIEATPNSPVTYRNRGFSHLKLKNYDAAERDYTEAIRLDGGNALAFRMRGSIRLVHKAEKDWKAILDDLREAARLDDDDAKTNYYLAFVFANCPDKAYRDVSKAVFHADKACKATNYDDWEHLAMLAAAHAAAGQFQEALARIEQAEQRAPEANKTDLRALAESYRKK